MKRIIYIWLLFFTSVLFGQIKDRRAELDIQGRITEISVSPNEKIWLVSAMSNTYYADNISSDWHYGESFSESTGEFSFGNTHLDRITFFNKDTAIMTGYVSASEKGSEKNGLYFTNNGGETWKLIDFGGSSWIYNAFVDKKGNAWIGGSSGEIFFSSDYGLHWKKLNSPYNSSSRMHSIFMLNQTQGISGALENEMYMTSNNWQSSKRIETPYDQKKHTNEGNHPDHRIEKVLFWNNLIVVSQDKHVYYSETNKIDWKSFPVKMSDFELDTEAKSIFAIIEGLKIVSFTSPTEFQLLTDKCLFHPPIDIKIVNHSLFVLSEDESVYKVNRSEFIHSMLYTTDKKISKPRIVKQGTKLTWGANWNQLYIANNHEQNWYREKVLDYKVTDFQLLNDSIAVFWDGINNYIYSLKDHTSQKYFPKAPLKTFLTSPIETFTINSGSRGCFHGENDEVNYKSINDSIFVTIASANSQYKKPSTFKNTVSGSVLINILNVISSNSSTVPSLKDFQITEKSKQNYLELVDTQFKGKNSRHWSRNRKIDKVFYYAVPAMLDTLNGSIITDILTQPEKGWSTTSNWFNIQMVNKNNDTLNISRDYYINPFAWNLPWKFQYKGLNFNCYNIEFSRFIDSCIPENFMNKEAFDNRILLMQIADYLWDRKE